MVRKQRHFSQLRGHSSPLPAYASGIGPLMTIGAISATGPVAVTTIAVRRPSARATPRQRPRVWVASPAPGRAVRSLTPERTALHRPART